MTSTIQIHPRLNQALADFYRPLGGGSVASGTLLALEVFPEVMDSSIDEVARAGISPDEARALYDVLPESAAMSSLVGRHVSLLGSASVAKYTRAQRVAVELLAHKCRAKGPSGRDVFVLRLTGGVR